MFQYFHYRIHVCGELTAFNGVGGGLQGYRPAVGLVDVHPENQPHSSVFASDVCFTFAKLNVRITQLQNPGTIDSRRKTNKEKIADF